MIFIATEKKQRFVMVETPPQIGATNRNPAGGTLHPSGLLPLNAKASDCWRDLVKASGQPLDNHLVKFGVDVPGLSVAAYVMPHGTTGCAPVRINQRTKSTDTFTFYLSGVFAEHHELRPVGKRTITVGKDVDEAGVPIMIISLASQLQTRTTFTDQTIQDREAKQAAARAKAQARKARRQQQNGNTTPHT